MAKAKVESQDHGNNDQGHGKATAKDHITFKTYIYMLSNTTIVGSLMCGVHYSKPSR